MNLNDSNNSKLKLRICVQKYERKLFASFGSGEIVEFCRAFQSFCRIFRGFAWNETQIDRE